MTPDIAPDNRPSDIANSLKLELLPGSMMLFARMFTEFSGRLVGLTRLGMP